MGLKGEKKATAVVAIGTTTYGPFEFNTFTGHKLTAAAAKKRRGAGQARKVRVGPSDVENGTATIEDDGTIDLKFFWNQRRKAVWTITDTPADADGNARAKDAATYTGKQVGLEFGDVDIEADEDIDMATLEFAFDSTVS